MWLFENSCHVMIRSDVMSVESGVLMTITPLSLCSIRRKVSNKCSVRTNLVHLSFLLDTILVYNNLPLSVTRILHLQDVQSAKQGIVQSVQ